MCFIDTHIAVWLYEGRLDLLSRRAKKILEENEIYISPFVLLELEYLYEIKRIKVKGKKIIDHLSEKIGLKIDNIGFEDVVLAALQEKWTRDPFDRIIVSQAKKRRAVLISRDEKIQNKYARSIS